jgi:hypothetical protein
MLWWLPVYVRQDGAALSPFGGFAEDYAIGVQPPTSRDQWRIQRQHWNYRKVSLLPLDGTVRSLEISSSVPGYQGSGHWSHLVCEVIEDRRRIQIAVKLVLCLSQSEQEIIQQMRTKKLPILLAELFKILYDLCRQSIRIS